MRRYKGGGGTPAPQEVTTQTSNLPEYVEPYYKRLLQRGEAESLQGYTPYGGQRLEYFAPDDAASMGQGYQAGNLQSGYQAGQVGEQYNPMNYEQNINRFMSPYQQNVIDIEKREARRASDIAGKQSGDAATQVGGLGGYREAIVQAERERNLGQQLGDIQSRGSQRAFESAQQQLERERAAGMGAAKFGLDQFGAGQAARQAQEQCKLRDRRGYKHIKLENKPDNKQLNLV